MPATPGRKLDGERIGLSLVTNLAARAHRARFVVARPKLTTEAAKKLRITELVSEFTTNYPCCAPRVTNIKRAAALLDGTIILPGKKFSLNGALGKRTEAKGFVSAPQIFNGRFEEAVGGGISQVATTLFNAAFFSGIKLVAHQAHQFYISRYPMGREATVSWGGPELDLPERLARCDPDEARSGRRRDHGAVLLHEARAPRDDDDREAVQADDPEDDHRDQLGAAGRCA